MQPGKWQDQVVQVRGSARIMTEPVREAIFQATKGHAETRMFFRTAPGPLGPLPKELANHCVVLGSQRARSLGLPPSLGVKVYCFSQLSSVLCAGAHRTASALRWQQDT